MSLAKRNAKLIICSASAIFAAFAHVEDPIFLILLSRRELTYIVGEQKEIVFCLYLILPLWIKILWPERARHSPSFLSRNGPSNAAADGKSGKSIQKWDARSRRLFSRRFCYFTAAPLEPSGGEFMKAARETRLRLVVRGKRPVFGLNLVA